MMEQRDQPPHRHESTANRAHHCLELIIKQSFRMSSDSPAFQKFYVYGGGRGKSAGFGSHTVAHVELGAGITTEHKKYYVQGELYGIISQVPSERIILNLDEPC